MVGGGRRSRRSALRASGTELHLAIPRHGDRPPRRRRAAWQSTSNGPTTPSIPGDILDFYVSGDVAPEGRYKFRYEAQVDGDKPNEPKK